MNRIIHKLYQLHSVNLNNFIQNFEMQGEAYGNQERNSLKLFKLNDKTINVKSFKIPNLINQIAYRFFRKSKAHRSFEYANKLTELRIGTPQPIAFFEFTTALFFKKSYYVSEHLECDLTYRELTTNLNYPDHEIILRAFTRFTFNMHEKGINFLDHSPGNTLIKKVGEEYEFYLVDLNRMEFKPMDFEARIKNFSRLTKQESLVKIMANEYAKLINKKDALVYEKMWNDVEVFQQKFMRRKRLKKKLKFWKS